MAIRDDFEIVASQVRVALQRFALALLVIAAFGAMLIGKADTVLVENARVLALDLASPALEAIARPVAVANRAIADLKEFASLREENARLRELSQFREGPEASFITARIVGDSVSAYVRGALLNVGRRVGVMPGQAVVTGEGLAGRVAEVGDNSARVLFVTDVNSRLPVLVERTRERAILAGDNSAQMRLTRSHHHLGPWRQLPGRHSGRRSGAGGRRHQRARPPVRRLLAPGIRARRRLRRDRSGGVCRTGGAGDALQPAEPLRCGLTACSRCSTAGVG
jgi:hypothetical protein